MRVDENFCNVEVKSKHGRLGKGEEESNSSGSFDELRSEHLGEIPTQTDERALLF